MKVVAVVPRYPPHSLVGAWMTTHEFLRGLAGRGHDVQVLTIRSTVTYAHDGITVRPREPNGAVVRGADVLISHLGDDGRTADDAHRLGVPSVRMVHGSHPQNRQRLARRPPALVVANSWATAAELGDEWLTIVCHPPVHAELYRTTPGDLTTLVNLSANKGGVLLARLAKRMPARRFLGVRGAYGPQVLRQPVNVAVEPTTLDMRGVYSRTRVLLMPSERETWGRVGVEAMASGIPVVAHPTDGLCESLGAAGIFADRDDPAAWMGALERLDDPDEWAKASELALARSAELDPRADVERFCGRVEHLAAVAA